MDDPRDAEERLRQSRETLEWSKQALEHEQQRRPRVLRLSDSFKRLHTENHFSEKLRDLFDGS